MSSRFICLDNYWATFQRQHFDILAFEAAARSKYYISDVFSITEETYFEVRSQFLIGLERFKASTEPSRGDAGTTSAMPLIKQMQLLKIALPKFSEDQLAWENFRDLFKSLVHDVVEIPSVQRLQYLKSALSGEALDVVANIPLTDAAYVGAWTDLNKRYGNQRVLLFSRICATS